MLRDSLRTGRERQSLFIQQYKDHTSRTSHAPIHRAPPFVQPLSSDNTPPPTSSSDQPLSDSSSSPVRQKHPSSNYPGTGRESRNYPETGWETGLGRREEPSDPAGATSPTGLDGRYTNDLDSVIASSSDGDDPVSKNRPSGHSGGPIGGGGGGWGRGRALAENEDAVVAARLANQSDPSSRTGLTSSGGGGGGGGYRESRTFQENEWLMVSCQFCMHVRISL